LPTVTPILIVVLKVSYIFNLGSDLGSFLWVYHADMFKVFESMLSVFLLSTHILLQHVEYVTRLQGRKRTKNHQFRMTRFHFLN
uniref:Uncharacterized protein n=1 Tax=Cyanoderma ruficeps TaxID=181631 RepID=A0A8C3NQ67_9PASS